MRVRVVVRLAVGVIVQGHAARRFLAASQEILARPATPFVEALVGTGERPFKLLSLKPVSEAMEPGIVEGEPVSATATQRDALAALLWSGRPALPVQSEEGVIIGKVTVEGLIKRAARPA